MADWPLCYHEFFSRLRGVKRTKPDHWMALCPAHDNEATPALSVGVGDGKNLVMKCMSTKPGAACSNESILEALGLGFGSLYEEPHGSGGEKLTFVEAYDYVDETRTLLFQVVRYNEESGAKTFRQRRPNPDYDPDIEVSPENRRWIANGKNRRRILYKLPQLLDAMAEHPERWVLIVEGEKAVNRVWKSDINLLATTNDAGALHWTSIDHVIPLSGRKVVIVEDNDPAPAGEAIPDNVKRTRQVGLSLYGLAAEVRVLRLEDTPVKGGLDDWFLAWEGSLKERKKELYQRVLDAPHFRPYPVELDERSELIAAAMTREKMRRKDAAEGEEWLGRLRADYLRLEAALVGQRPVDETRELAIRLTACALRGVKP